MEPENTPPEKENHLPNFQTIIFRFKLLIFRADIYNYIFSFFLDHVHLGTWGVFSEKKTMHIYRYSYDFTKYVESPVGKFGATHLFPQVIGCPGRSCAHVL